MATKGEATRARLIDQALNQVTVRGLAAVSLADVAAASGVSKSAVLKHFQSKEALQAELLDEMIARFKAAVWDPAEPLPAGRERLDGIFRNEMDWTDGRDLEGGCPIKAATIELDDQPGPLRDALKASQLLWEKTLKREFRTLYPQATDDAVAVKLFQYKGLLLAYSHSRRLLDDASARRQATAAWEALAASPA